VQGSSQMITTNKPTSRFFTGRMPFLSPNQQCQSTEGKTSEISLSTLYSQKDWNKVFTYINFWSLQYFLHFLYIPVGSRLDQLLIEITRNMSLKQFLQQCTQSFCYASEQNAPHSLACTDNLNLPQVCKVNGVYTKVLILLVLQT